MEENKKINSVLLNKILLFINTITLVILLVKGGLFYTVKHKNIVDEVSPAMEKNKLLSNPRTYDSLQRVLYTSNDIKSFISVSNIYWNSGRSKEFALHALKYAHKNNSLFALSEYSKIISSPIWGLNEFPIQNQYLALYYYAKIHELGGDSIIKYELKYIQEMYGDIKSSHEYLMSYDSLLTKLK
jgi:hypothetical protein